VVDTCRKTEWSAPRERLSPAVSPKSRKRKIWRLKPSSARGF